jgi:hypothetical protein
MFAHPFLRGLVDRLAAYVDVSFVHYHHLLSWSWMRLATVAGEFILFSSAQYLSKGSPDASG